MFIDENLKKCCSAIILIFLLLTPAMLLANTLDSLFFQAVVRGEAEKAVSYLNLGANINAQDDTGATLLHKAVLYSNMSVAQWLLDRGADVDMQVGKSNMTPLMLAAHQQDVPMCQFLLEHKATIGIKDIYGSTAADYALKTGYMALANYLRNPRQKLEKPYLAELISKATTAFNNCDYIEAIKLNKELCARLKKEIAPTNILYTKGLNDLGMCYIAIGDYAKAKKYLKEAVSMAKKYTPNSNIYYTRRIYYSSVLFNNAEYDEAFSIYLDCLQHMDIITDSQMRWIICNNMGVIATNWGQYELAEKMLLKAFVIGKNIFENNDKEYAMYAFSMANLGGMYMEQGNSNVQEKAESYLSMALEIYETHNDYGREYAGAYKNYGALMANIGNYELALSIYQSYADIVARIWGKEHDEYAYALDAISGIYIREQKYEEALHLLKEAKRIRESNHSMQTPEGASLLVNLGDMCERVEIAHPEIKTSAEKYFIEAINILEKTIGRDNLKYAGAINYLSAYYYRYQRYQEAIDMEEKSMTIIENAIGKQNQNYLTFYANKCATYQAQHKWSDALLAWENFTDEFKLYVKDMFPILSEEERNLFWNSSWGWRYESVIPSMAHLCNDSTINVTSFVYNNILFTKGILLFSSEQIRRSIQNSGDENLLRILKELNLSKEKLMLKQECQGSSYAKERDSIQQHIRSLDKYLSLHSKEYKKGNDTWDYNWEMVQMALPDNSVALEFASFNLWDHYETDSTLYAVFLVDKKSISPIYIPLFEENDILSATNTITESLINETHSISRRGSDLTKLIFEKIFPYIKPGQTIYFSPSGVLYQVAIESLPYDSISTMSDHFNMVRLSSTREIVLRNNNEHKESAVLYGGIQYDVDTTELLVESRQYEHSPLLASRGIENDTINRGSVKYLWGTKKEAESINRLLAKHNVSATLYTSTAANEESFKALSGKHQNIIHIGTHGFYWADSTAHKQDFFTQRSLSMGDDLPIQYTIDPLDRCGLLFAGANMALSGHSRDLPEGVQDGILTAKEISLMDLRDCDLVVLSACETAKGDITSEGVFGLQRAFKMAGVQTIIMSLWKVDDNATQMLMTEFYTNWIEKKQSKREAFKNAQNAVRFAVDKYGDRMYADPVYWAGFIMLD